MLRDMGGEWRVETAKPHMQIFTEVVLVAFFRLCSSLNLSDYILHKTALPYRSLLRTFGRAVKA